MQAQNKTCFLFTNTVSQSMKRMEEPKMGTNEYIYPVLLSMYNEQSDHIHSRFNEAYVKYRQVVVEWMLDVAEYFNLHITTTHAAIAYLDRLQPNEKFSRIEWQMMAICCLLISSKYNEMEENVPPLRKLEDITQQTIANEAILNYELWALKRMSWKLNARTPVSFLSAYMELGLLRTKDMQRGDSDMSRDDLTEMLHDKIQSLATKCILDVRFKGIQASAIACAIVYHSRRSCNIFPVWHEDLSHMTFHDPSSSKSTIRALELLMEMELEEEAAAASEEKQPETEHAPITPTKTSPDSKEELDEIKFSDPVGVAAITTPEMSKDSHKERGMFSDISPVSIANIDL